MGCGRSSRSSDFPPPSGYDLRIMMIVENKSYVCQGCGIRYFDGRGAVCAHCDRVQDRAFYFAMAGMTEESQPLPWRRRATSRETRLDTRLLVTLKAIQQVADEILDDDGEYVIVKRSTLHTALGIARRNREDLEGGTL